MADEQESRSRRIALAVFAGVVVLFIALSGASFVQARQRPDPAMVVFQGQTAVDGKRVFQAYNCMGCHTVLGNGAYFAPDITGVYATNGPAWLIAWFSAPEVWPTKPVVDQWIERLIQSGDLDATSVDAYYQTYDGAASDNAIRGGSTSFMPHLIFRAGETAALVAFMDYASQINTEGWPPESQANPDIVSRVQAQLWQGFLGIRPTPVGAPTLLLTPVPPTATPVPTDTPVPTATPTP